MTRKQLVAIEIRAAELAYLALDTGDKVLSVMTVSERIGWCAHAAQEQPHVRWRALAPRSEPRLTGWLAREIWGEYLDADREVMLMKEESRKAKEWREQLDGTKWNAGQDD